jgi:hypothetical protein
MKKHLLLFFLFTATIGYSQEKPIEVPKIIVKIAIGETATFKKAIVKFLKVVEDSRCPADVNCIWEGQATVLVEVTEVGKETTQVELGFGKIKNVSLFSSEGYSLEGISLNPYPSANTSEKIEYSLLVSEEDN